MTFLSSFRGNLREENSYNSYRKKKNRYFVTRKHFYAL